MTVLKGNFTNSVCPTPPLRKLGDVAIVTVDDRSPELELMDDDITTCLVVLEQGQSKFHLMAYIHTPGSVHFLRLTLQTTGLACTIPELVVYHQVQMAGRYGEIQYQECGLNDTRDVGGTRQQCEFLCYNIKAEASVVIVGIHAEKVHWNYREFGTGSVCGMAVSNVWKISRNLGKNSNIHLSK